MEKKKHSGIKRNAIKGLVALTLLSPINGYASSDNSVSPTWSQRTFSRGIASKKSDIKSDEVVFGYHVGTVLKNGKDMYTNASHNVLVVGSDGYSLNGDSLERVSTKQEAMNILDNMKSVYGGLDAYSVSDNVCGKDDGFGREDFATVFKGKKEKWDSDKEDERVGIKRYLAWFEQQNGECSSDYGLLIRESKEAYSEGSAGAGAAAGGPSGQGGRSGGSR